MERQVSAWRDRKQQLRRAPDLPARDRLVQTLSLAVGVGVLVEGSAALAGWYQFHPWWLVLVVVLAVFGGVMGGISYATFRSSRLTGFLAGAAVGVGAELLNHFVLHAWSFDPATFGRLPAPWIQSLVLGLPAGLMPLIVNASVRALYRRRLRLG